jgi:hypothetical protein
VKIFIKTENQDFEVDRSHKGAVFRFWDWNPVLPDPDPVRSKPFGRTRIIWEKKNLW